MKRDGKIFHGDGIFCIVPKTYESWEHGHETVLSKFHFAVYSFLALLKNLSVFHFYKMLDIACFLSFPPSQQKYNKLGIIIFYSVVKVKFAFNTLAYSLRSKIDDLLSLDTRISTPAAWKKRCLVQERTSKHCFQRCNSRYLIKFFLVINTWGSIEAWRLKNDITHFPNKCFGSCIVQTHVY
jgi:hypothetical protein